MHGWSTSVGTFRPGRLFVRWEQGVARCVRPALLPERARPWISATVLLVALAAPASRSAADENSFRKDEAGRHFEAGIQRSKKRDFAAALTEFETAHNILPRYEVLYNIGLVYAAIDT